MSEVSDTRSQLVEDIFRYSSVTYNLTVQEGAPPPPSSSKSPGPLDGIMKAVTTLATTGYMDRHGSKVVAATATIQLLPVARVGPNEIVDGATARATVTVVVNVSPPSSRHSSPTMGDTDWALSQNRLQTRTDPLPTAPGFSIETISAGKLSTEEALKESHSIPLENHLQDIVSFMNQKTPVVSEFLMLMIARCFPMIEFRLKSAKVLKSNIETALSGLPQREKMIELGDQSHERLVRKFRDYAVHLPNRSTLNTYGKLLDLLQDSYQDTCASSEKYREVLETQLARRSQFTRAQAQVKIAAHQLNRAKHMTTPSAGLSIRVFQGSANDHSKLESEQAAETAWSEAKAEVSATEVALLEMEKLVLDALMDLTASLNIFHALSSCQELDEVFDNSSMDDHLQELRENLAPYVRHDTVARPPVRHNPVASAVSPEKNGEDSVVEEVNDDLKVSEVGVDDDDDDGLESNPRTGLQLLHHLRKMTGVIAAVARLVGHKEGPRGSHIVSSLCFVSVNGFETPFTDKQVGIPGMVLDKVKQMAEAEKAKKAAEKVDEDESVEEDDDKKAAEEKATEENFTAWVNETLPKSLSCRGSVHCESILMALHHGCKTSAAHEPMEASLKASLQCISDEHKHAFSSPPTVFVAAKKPCAMCEALGKELKLVMPIGHGNFFPWIPPPGLSLSVLRNLRQKLEDKFGEVVSGLKTDYENFSNISRGSSPASEHRPAPERRDSDRPVSPKFQQAMLERGGGNVRVLERRRKVRDI